MGAGKGTIMHKTVIDSRVGVHVAGRAEVNATSEWATVRFHADGSEISLFADPDTLCDVLAAAVERVRFLASERVSA